MAREAASNQQFLKKLTEITEANLQNEQFGVSQLARKIGMSRSNLHRKIKSETGKSVSQFISQVRLEKAKELIRETSLPVSDIAFDTGFHSVSYFSKCFHEYFGVSPRQFRNKNKFLAPGRNRIYKKKLPIKKSIILIVLALFTISMAFLFKNNGLGNPSENESEKSIGIFPLTFVGESTEKKYLATGIMADIHYNLTKIENLQVLSLSSSDNYHRFTRNAKSIGDDLQVAYLLDGTLQIAEEEMNLIIRLIRTKDNKLIWSEKYLRNLDEILAVQSEISENIANELQIEIIPNEIKWMTKENSHFSLNAHDFYQRGLAQLLKFQMNNLDKEALHKAEQYFRKALEYDSEYARAYVGLGHVYREKNTGKEMFKKNFLDSLSFFAALMFDKNSAEAHSIKGLYFWYRGNKIKALEEYDKAIALNPSLWSAYRGKAILYLAANEPVKSITYFKKASYLNRGPELKNIFRGIIAAYSWAGLISEASEYNNEALQLFDDSVFYYTNLGAFEVQLGNPENAITFYEKAYTIDSSYTSFDWFYSDVIRQLGFNYSLIGNYKMALNYYKRWISQLSENAEIGFNGMHRIGFVYYKNGLEKVANHYFDIQMKYCNNLIATKHFWASNYFAYYDRAAVFAFRGDREKAYKDLNEFNKIANPPVWIVNLIKIDPLFERIKNDSEFQHIVTDLERKFSVQHEYMESELKVAI